MKGVFVCLSDRAAAVAADGTKKYERGDLSIGGGLKTQLLSIAAGGGGGSASSPLRRNGFGGFLGFLEGEVNNGPRNV